MVSSITPDALEEYKDLIRDTTSDLQEHITRLDERVRALAASEAESSVRDELEWTAIVEEKQSTQEGLKICLQLYAQIEQLGLSEREKAQFLQHFAGLTMFSLETAQRALLDDGFVDLEDATVGNVVLEMERRNFPYLTPFGLKYYKQHILENEVRAPPVLLCITLLMFAMISSVSGSLSNPRSASVASDTGCGTVLCPVISSASGEVVDRLAYVFSSSNSSAGTPRLRSGTVRICTIYLQPTAFGPCTRPLDLSLKRRVALPS
jgi:hypothetical protein